MFRAVLLAVATFAAVYSAPSTHVTKTVRSGAVFCAQEVAPPAADSGNFGDLICDYFLDWQSSPLILRETIVSSLDDSEVDVHIILKGYNISSVNTFNFGRYHGFTSTVSINNDLLDSVSSTGLIIVPPVEGEMRVFVEVYGNQIQEDVEIIRNITSIQGGPK